MSWIKSVWLYIRFEVIRDTVHTSCSINFYVIYCILDLYHLVFTFAGDIYPVIQF